MTKTALKKLRARLPKNYASIISEQLSFHPVYIYKVLTGEKHNEKIIEFAIQLAEEKKKNHEKLQERINAL